MPQQNKIEEVLEKIEPLIRVYDGRLKDLNVILNILSQKLQEVYEEGRKDGYNIGKDS